VLGGGSNIEKRAGGAGLTERVQVGGRNGFHGRNIKGNKRGSSKECGGENLRRLDFIFY
jgi:hypothetical protein